MTDESELSAEKLAEIYIKIRDKRAEIKDKYESEDSDLKDQMDMLAEKMLDICETQGADSLKTKTGTIIRKVDTRYWTSDWESFYDFVKDNEAYPLLEKRIHQTNMKQFLEEHPESFPPGMLVDSQYKIIVRRSK